ncbi:zinc finger protein 292a [Entelurus aequoreus]|uniref:zinc finger protein 292a n=1 Tax=Entelurus aequoreus TaxID=161455 RepID=UPI002B1D9779|nr:zinc finger protein 292a [Entelurus aequoreus]
MAEGETEKEYDTRKAIDELRGRFHGLTAALRESAQSPLEASLHFCQDFCQVLVEHAGRWKTDEDPLPLLEVYTLAVLSFAKAASCLSAECENVPLLLEKLALSCAELVLLLPENIPGALWEEFQSSMKLAHSLLQESGSAQLHPLFALAQQDGVWSNITLSSILSNTIPQTEQVHEYLELEGPNLLSMRVKHLIKIDSVDKAATLAKMCSEYPGYEGKGNFKQTYVLCVCMTKSQEQLMEEISPIDCKDALEMICNLESEGDEKGALCLCSAFLKRQLLQGEVYCAWELTLFWSKLLMRLETSPDTFLSHSKELALLCRSVCHILFLIKVIQNEVGEVGLPVCVEMCIQALKMTSSDNKDSKSTICKTISCILPTDLEVKRACQLTEFLLQPTVDSYYAVESLYNEPDQKPEEDGSLPVPNSLRCELLLALKTQWPFDPEFWDWKTLKCNCLSLMGEEAAIVSSIDTLNDTDEQEMESTLGKLPEYKDLEDFLLNTTNELSEITDEKEKNRETKKLREQGFVSARFRNWQAYMQYCVLCDKEFLGHRIVKHAQKHFKDGVYLCPICANGFETREVLEPHVALHVKESCKERLAAMKTVRKGIKPFHSPKSPSKSIGVDSVNINPQIGLQSTKVEQTTSEAQINPDCFCPVKNCSKAFKVFRNLMAHVRSHKNDDEAMRFLQIQKQKVVCQYCRRQFVNVRHLNDHLQMHCGSKPYICIQLDCKANFNSNSELLMHRKTHKDFKAKCMFPNCGQIFNEAYLLYDHEAQHYLTYTCQTDNCGKIFYSQTEFVAHQQIHNTPNAMVINKSSPVIPNVEPLQESVLCMVDTHPGVVCLDTNNSDAPMSEASMANISPCSSPDGVGELIPVRVKHSIENMLNSVAHIELRDPQKCYTPLTNPSLAPAAPVVPHAHHAMAKQATIPPVYPEPLEIHLVASQQGGGQTSQANNCQKVIPQMIAPSQIKTEIPSQGYPQTMPDVSNNDDNLHSCPHSECTRAYSTNKSLSRHVKKQHPEIFDDWKLAKKYNKVTNITARKARVAVTRQLPKENKPTNQPGQLCNKSEIEQINYPIGRSTSPAQCYPSSMDPVPITPMVNPTLYPSWSSSTNTSELMQPDMSQSWSAPPVNSTYPESFNMNEYPSRSYPQWQPDPYHGTQPPHPAEREQSMVALHGSTRSPSDSSLMSQYLSSSLMLDNGGQMHNGGHQFVLMPPEGSGVSMDIRKNSQSNLSVQVDNGNSMSTIHSLPEGSYHTPYAQSENSTSQSSPVNIPVKCSSPEAQAISKPATEIIKTENIAAPAYEQMDNAVDGMLSPHSVPQTDFNFEGDCTNAECEVADDKDDGEVLKGKRGKLSKRTKWPAIIKDGKVICRRCFREFSSTKSLGGHLSKRSQCRPVDEIDLTADLPTSFLDFLNDPLVPEANGAMFNMSNGDFVQEPCSLNALSSSIVLKQEPQNTNITDYSNVSAAGPENQQEKAAGLANTAVAAPHQEDHLMEISNAFQRLDLIEAAQEKMRSSLSQALNPPRCDTISDIKKSKPTTSKKEEKVLPKVSKPFKCDQAKCDFSFMTKEALFKHLCKMHNYSNIMIEELKRTPSKLSPYTCQFCSKTFTRTTGLRIHYEKVHRLSKAEVQKLKMSAKKKGTLRPNDVSSSSKSTAKASSVTNFPACFKTIKQEPLDIAIVPQIDTNNPETPQMASRGSPVNKGFPRTNTTVTCLPAAESYLNILTNDKSSVDRMQAVPERSREQLVAATSPDGTQQLISLPGKGEQPQGGKIKAPKFNPPVCSASYSPEKPSSSKTAPIQDETQKKLKKRLGLKMCDSDNAFNPYRPYRCVHEGCTAAFTIQHNLILHYRAMHQSSLPQSKAERSTESMSFPNGQESYENMDDHEIRCQVKNCSRVFMGITRLVQHYLLLHKFSRDKATSMMASMPIGTFNCDRPECALPFSSVDMYIEHIRSLHKEIAVSDRSSADITCRCTHEGCNRFYSTKSNLLRHLIKKHDYVHNPRATDRRRIKAVGPFPGVNNGKENMENKFKMKKKLLKKKDGKAIEHWTNFGKPTLKTHEEASAMCTKKWSLQYPCMLIGCDAVERAEKSIFKHYVTHGLTERYIEDQRSQFIFCKKFPRSRCKGADKQEGVSGTSSEETEPEEGEKSTNQNVNSAADADANADANATADANEDADADVAANAFVAENADTVANADSDTVANANADANADADTVAEAVEIIPQEDTKLSIDESAESQISTVTESGVKRGRPRKPAIPTPACPQRMQTLRNRTTVSSSTENSNPGTPVATEQRDEAVMQGSFKPLGLEDSFLKFLETSESTHTSKRKSSDTPADELPSKRRQTLKLRSAVRTRTGCAKLVNFRNPHNLKSVSNVKIVMDSRMLSRGADLLLKQLQDMKPMVIIKRWLFSGS